MWDTGIRSYLAAAVAVVEVGLEVVERAGHRHLLPHVHQPPDKLVAPYILLKVADTYMHALRWERLYVVAGVVVALVFPRSYHTTQMDTLPLRHCKSANLDLFHNYKCPRLLAQNALLPGIKACSKYLSRYRGI